MVEENIILNAVYEACHSNNSLIQTNAMKFLYSNEGKINIITSLLSILSYSSDSNINFNSLSSTIKITDDCKLLAIICLKNNVDHCWIARKNNNIDQNDNISISNNEKYLLRNSVLNLLDNNNTKISIQLAILIARIARHDWPNEWPNLFNDIFQNVSSTNWTISTNATQTLLQVILVLHSRKLLKNKQQFVSIATDIIQPLVGHWDSLHTQFLSLNFDPTNEFETISYINAFGNHLCTLTRIIQIIFLQSFKLINDSSFINSFLNLIGSYIQRYDQLLSTIPKLANDYQKLSTNEQESISYIKFIFNSTEFGPIGSDIWSSIASWQDGNDPVDLGLPTTGSICYNYGLDSIDIPATILASHLQRYLKVTCQSIIQISLTVSRVLMSLVVIPYHLQRECSTLNQMESLISPFLSLYSINLQKQFPYLLNHNLLNTNLNSNDHQSVCEPLAIVYTLFLSNILTSYSGDDLRSQSTTVNQFFLLPDALSSTLSSSSSLSSNETTFYRLFNLLTLNLLPLSKYYFDSWMIDSEEMYLSIQSSNEGDSLRLASEGLLSSMISYAPDETCAYLYNVITNTERQQVLSIDLMNLIENYSNISEKSFIELQHELLYWEGIYTCCGLTPYQLSERYDMSTWLVEVVGPLLTSLYQIGINDQQRSLKSTYPVYYLLQSLIYRIMWLLSCWTHIFEEQTLVQIIHLLVSFIQPPNQNQHHTNSNKSSSFDILIKLQVIHSLDLILHSNNFQSYMFSSVIENLFYGSCNLLKELSDPHSQGLIITLFQDIIQTVGHVSSSFLLILIKYLIPLYYAEDDDNNSNNNNNNNNNNNWNDENNNTTDVYGQEQENSTNILRSQLIELFTTVVDILANPYLTVSSSSLSSSSSFVSLLSDNNDENDQNLIPNYHEIHELLLPIIHHSTSGHSNTSHLIKSGMLLWSKLLRNTIYLPNNHNISIKQKEKLESIFASNIMLVFQNDFLGIEYEEMKVFFSILESSILLGGINMILSSPFCEIYSRLYQNILGEIKPRIISYAVRPIECLLLLQSFVNQIEKITDSSINSFNYSSNIIAIQNVLNDNRYLLSSEFLYSSGILKIMLRSCCSVFHTISSSEEHNILFLRIQTIYESCQEVDVVIISYISILCRIMILTPQVFIGLCQDIVIELNSQSLVEVSSEFILKSYLLLILNKFDSIGYNRGGIWHRRICCCGILSFYYPTQDEDVLRLLPDILSIVDDILSENVTSECINKLKKLSRTYLSLTDDYDDNDDDDDDNIEGGDNNDNNDKSNEVVIQKKKEMINYLFEELITYDIVLNISLHELVMSKLQEISNIIGQEQLERNFLNEMDQGIWMRIVSNEYQDLSKED